MKFTKIRHFNMAAEGFLQKDSANVSTKLGYAIKKVYDKSIKAIMEEYQNGYQELYYTHVEVIAIDNALTDKATGAILNAPKDSVRPYQYTKDGLKEVMKAEREFQNHVAKYNADFDEKEFEIDTFFVTELPEDLSDVELKAFEGFVLEAKQ